MAERVKAVYEKLKESSLPVKGETDVYFFPSNIRKLVETIGDQNGIFNSLEDNLVVEFDVNKMKDEITIPYELHSAFLFVGEGQRGSGAGLLQIKPREKKYRIDGIAKRYIGKIKKVMEQLGFREDVE